MRGGASAEVNCRDVVGNCDLGNATLVIVYNTKFLTGIISYVQGLTSFGYSIAR